MLEKIIALKEDLFSLKNRVKVLVLTGVIIILVGGMIVSISYFSKSGNKSACVGVACGTATTSQSTLLRPDWDPKTRDICGDGICGITEEVGPNVCSKDCSSNVPLTISGFTATPAVVAPGQTAVLSWSSTASFCASSGSEDAWFVTGGAASGSVSTSPLKSSKTYTLSCMNNAGELQTKDVTVMVGSSTVKPSINKIQPPTITFTANPSAINAGQSTTLFWIASNATSCVASGGAQWGWTGARGTKGTQVTPVLTSDGSYSLTCNGSGGSTTKNVKVVVSNNVAGGGTPIGGDFSGNTNSGNGSTPSVSFRVSRTNISSGETTTILWYSADAASCIAGGDGSSWGWTGPIPTSGAKVTPSLNNNQTFAITCKNAQGISSTENASVEVAPTTSGVTASTPTVSFSVNGGDKANVTSGGNATLAWSSENATSCNTTDYGGESWNWHGELPLSGTRTTPALTATQSFHITCLGDGGKSISKYVTVSVPAVLPSIKLPKLTVSSKPSSGVPGCLLRITYTLSPASDTASCHFSDWHTNTLFGADNSALVIKGIDDPETFTVTCDTDSGKITSSVSVKIDVARVAITGGLRCLPTNAF